MKAQTLLISILLLSSIAFVQAVQENTLPAPVDPTLTFAPVPPVSINPTLTTTPLPPVPVEPIRLLGNFKDQAIDENGNGYYEYLEISFDVYIPQTGTYTFHGILEEGQETLQELFYDLPRGRHRVQVYYRGFQFTQTQQNGPYRLSTIIATNLDNGDSADFATTYKTKEYKYTEFNPSVGVTIQSDWKDKGEDTNGNGYYEYLVITVPVQVDQVGTYNFDMTIQDKAFKDLQPLEGKYRTLEEGDTEIQFTYNGTELRETGINTNYPLRLQLTTYGYTQTYKYKTTHYNANEFEASPNNNGGNNGGSGNGGSNGNSGGGTYPESIFLNTNNNQNQEDEQTQTNNDEETQTNTETTPRRGFLEAITGAVIGGGTRSAGLAILFIGIILAAYYTVTNRKEAKTKKK